MHYSLLFQLVNHCYWWLVLNKMKTSNQTQLYTKYNMQKSCQSSKWVCTKAWKLKKERTNLARTSSVSSWRGNTPSQTKQSDQQIEANEKLESLQELHQKQLNRHHKNRDVPYFSVENHSNKEIIKSNKPGKSRPWMHTRWLGSLE